MVDQTICTKHGIKIFLLNNDSLKISKNAVIDDANNASNGINIVGVNAKNSPFPEFFAVILTIFSNIGDGYAVQIELPLTYLHNGNLAVRTKDNGTWYDWNILS